MTEKLNVHYYDGHWVDEQYLSKVKILSLQTKNENIESLKNRLSSYQKNGRFVFVGSALNNFNTIAASNTFDPANNVYVFDLLYMLEDMCKKYDDCSDLLDMIIEQLEDMSTGLCAQGRTTRLYQLLISFIEEEM